MKRQLVTEKNRESPRDDHRSNQSWSIEEESRGFSSRKPEMRFLMSKSACLSRDAVDRNCCQWRRLLRSVQRRYMEAFHAMRMSDRWNFGREDACRLHRPVSQFLEGVQFAFLARPDHRFHE
ncbi:hypothetical protein F2Q69_00024825 [Brassica cretica]|uniref:Uncharacterized protein n=1 Tax=Brassica cretica TaxID=69181 RepID=A0A8S9QEI4_BRACR|nr:hypothetical protein F2Q69_00024825 [Brassica cretica]